MSILLAVLLWIAVVLAGLLLLVLLVPLSVRAHGGVHGERAGGRLDVRWGGGVIRVTAGTEEIGRVRVLGLPLFRVGGGRRREKPRPERKKDERRKEKGSQRRMRLGEAWGHRRTLWMAGRRMLGTLHLRGRIEGTVGLADPSDTAILHGLLATVGGGRRLAVDVDCDWMDETLELDGTLRGFVWPPQAAVVLLVLWLRRDVRRALRALR